MMKLRAACVVGLLVIVPSAVFAQASITGVVKDSSGAVLPGVTVEASSPALIEKVRTAVTDDAGRYRIVDLRAGTYAVTFTLTGSSTRQARRHRAARHVHRHGRRRAEGRLARGDDHRHRRVADRRRAEHPAADGHRQRHHHVDSGLALVQQPDAADAEHRHAGGRRDGHAGRARHGGLRRRRRAQQRRPREASTASASARRSTAPACRPTSPTSATRAK